MNAQTVDKNLLLHLLAENELTRREIAKRVGCSAERVRQLELKLLHRTGHEAKRERRERKLQESFERNEFVKAAKRRGFNVEPSRRAPLDWYKREFYVNGKFCLLRRAYDNAGYKGWYTAIRKPRQRAEICVMELGKRRFLIIPMKKMPRSSTMFRLDDADSKSVYVLRRHWREYLNNWAAFNQRNDRRLGRQIRHR
jgi:hypothetical protein